jgi:hypothetical protein
MGYVRTSTTMHQLQIFPRNPMIHYMGKPFADETLLDAFRTLACSDTAQFDPACYEVLRVGARPLADAPVSCTVLSDEIILSMQGADIDIVTDRLRSAFGDIKVLVTIRKQFDVFQSWAEHVLKKNEYGALATIVEYHYKHRHTRDSILYYLDYRAFYDYFSAKLGPDKVMFLPYELMRKDAPAYARLLADFLGVPVSPVNDAIASATVENQRRRRSDIAFTDFRKRHLSPRRQKTMDRLGSAAFRVLNLNGKSAARILDEVRGDLDREFAVTNAPLRRTLKERIAVDIADLGYALPA